MKKTLLAVMMFTPLIANAASVQNMSSQNADITITAPNAFTHTLTAVRGLTAGPATTPLQVASGLIQSVAGASPASYAVQFAAGGSNANSPAGVGGAFKGKNNPANVLYLNLKKDPTMSLATSNQTVAGSSWLVYPVASSFKYVIETPISESIPADTYAITVNAAIYTP
ncbi:hypothetical protein QSI79_23310 [Enterobacter asburiae]|uniref:hypothetical protein n=1 Tax=Enterobacter asburiae TaxID=61645 RepID=UPI00287A2324|nr:hypothetical protein [Enterobacter asburiae]MDS1916218.1 hypothetical protein [Enterobacter asburiae]